MINQHESNGPRPRFLFVLGAGLAAGALLLSPGCGKKEEPPPVVVVAPPPPPPPPQPTPTDLFAEHNIDPRISIAADEIPVDDQNPELATKKLVAVLKFFDAMVRGSDDRMKPMLASADQKVLAELVQSGAFQPAAKAVTRVVLGCGGFQLGFETQDAVFALVQSGATFDAQLWTYKMDENGNVVFDAAPTPPDILNKLTGTKAAPRIRQWAQAMKEKLEEAKKPDETIEIPQVDYGSGAEGEGGEGDGGGGGQPSAPSPRPGGGGSEPGKKTPKPGGVPAPKPPGLG